MSRLVKNLQTGMWNNTDRWFPKSYAQHPATLKMPGNVIRNNDSYSLSWNRVLPGEMQIQCDQLGRICVGARPRPMVLPMDLQRLVVIGWFLEDQGYVRRKDIPRGFWPSGIDRYRDSDPADDDWIGIKAELKLADGTLIGTAVTASHTYYDDSERLIDRIVADMMLIGESMAVGQVARPAIHSRHSGFAFQPAPGGAARARGQGRHDFIVEIAENQTPCVSTDLEIRGTWRLSGGMALRVTDGTPEAPRTAKDVRRLVAA